MMDADPQWLVIDTDTKKQINIDDSSLQLIYVLTTSGIVKYEDRKDMPFSIVSINLLLISKG